MSINLNVLKYFFVLLTSFIPMVKATAQSVAALETATLPLTGLALLSSTGWDKNLTGPYPGILKMDKPSAEKKLPDSPITDTFKSKTEIIASPDLLQFSAIVSNNNAMLQWKISDLLYIRALFVEESLDGTTFNGISEITTDKGEKINGLVIAQQNERILYRLKILDTGGQVYYTKSFVCTVDMYASGSASLTPDAVTDEWLSFINITTPYRGKVKIVVSNALGQQLIEFRQEITSERSRIPIGVAAIPKGTYYIFVSKNDGTHIGRGLELQKN